MKDYLFVLSLAISLSQIVEAQYNIFDGQLITVFYTFIVVTVLYVLVFLYNKFRGR
nr:MAG TPA: hypothetical protein [Caudoviricetes sp.]